MALGFCLEARVLISWPAQVKSPGSNNQLEMNSFQSLLFMPEPDSRPVDDYD